MRKCLPVLLACFLFTAAQAITPKKKSSGKATHKTSASHTPAKGKKSSARSTSPARQAAPTPERYKEIQQALAAKGYLPTENVTGQWGDTSTDALKKFQADQSLDATGKINSLSLIALGLGPKHESTTQGTP
jgi:peptidoglycan hydrolase-like protein with peptidoglycan-binding domain